MTFVEYSYGVSYGSVGHGLGRRTPIASTEEFVRVFVGLGGGEARVAEVAEALEGSAAQIWELVTGGRVDHLTLVISDFGSFYALAADLEGGTLVWDSERRRVELS